MHNIIITVEQEMSKGDTITGKSSIFQWRTPLIALYKSEMARQADTTIFYVDTYMCTRVE